MRKVLPPWHSQQGIRARLASFRVASRYSEDRLEGRGGFGFAPGIHECGDDQLRIRENRDLGSHGSVRPVMGMHDFEARIGLDPPAARVKPTALTVLRQSL